MNILGSLSEFTVHYPFTLISLGFNAGYMISRFSCWRRVEMDSLVVLGESIALGDLIWLR